MTIIKLVGSKGKLVAGTDSNQVQDINNVDEHGYRWRCNPFEVYGLPILTANHPPHNSLRLTWHRVHLHLRQVIMLVSLVCLIVSTGRSTFHKSIEMELISKERIPIPNIKFHYLLSFHIKTYIATISYLYMLFRAKKIDQFMRKLLGRLAAAESRRQLCRVRLILELTWLVNVILNGAFFIWLALEMNEMQHSYANNNNPKDSKIVGATLDAGQQLRERIILLVRETLWAIYGFGWILHTVLFMIWAIYANYRLELETMAAIDWKRPLATVSYPASVYHIYQHQQQHEGTLAQVRQLYRKLTMLTNATKTINEVLGFLPLLWLSEVFISTCLRLTQVAILAGMQKTASMRRELEGMLKHKIEFNHFENFVEFFVLCTAYLAFIVVAQRLGAKRVERARLEHYLLDLSKQTMAHGRSGEMDTLVLATNQMIDRFEHSGYIAWCEFRMNYRLMFAFINAVAPFSVMILQLNGQ